MDLGLKLIVVLIMLLIGIGIIVLTRLYLYSRDDKQIKFFSKEGINQLRRKNPMLLAVGSFLVYSVIIILNIFVWKNDIWSVVKNSLVFLWLVPIALIDYKEQIIPNKLVVVGLIYWVIFIIVDCFVLKNNPLFDIIKVSFWGMLLGGLLFLIPSIITKNGVGMGDVKLFGTLGLIYGFSLSESTNVFTIIFLTIVLIFFVGIVLIICQKATRKSTLPMAPYLFMAFTFASLTGLLK